MEHPILFAYLHHHHAVVQTSSFCQLWAILEYVFNGTILMLLCYVSIERHLVLFHRAFLHRYLLAFHYIPMMFAVSYPFVLYVPLILFDPCENQFDYKVMVCAGPCYLYEKVVSALDIIMNLAVPLSLCTIANLCTLVRILHRKYRMRQQQVWKSNRRLICQLLSIVFLHDLVWFPAIVGLLIILSSSTPLIALANVTLNILPYGHYMVIMLYPIVSIIIRPELRPHLLKNVVRSIHRGQRMRTLS